MEPWNWKSAHWKISNYALEFSKAYRLSIGQVCYTCAECKRGVYCRSDGMLKLLPYTHSRILQAANAAHLIVVLTLYDLAYVSSEQAVLYCSQPSATNLSVPQADWPRLSCRNQGGRLPKQQQVLQKCFLKDTIGWTQGAFIQEKRHNKHCWYDPAWRYSGQSEHNNQIFSCIQSHKQDPLKRCSTACVAFLQFYFLSNVIQLVFDDIHEDVVTDEVVAMSCWFSFCICFHPHSAFQELLIFQCV